MPGGVVEPLSAKAEAEINRKFPALPLDRLNRIVEEYRIYRQHQRTAPTPKEVRSELDRIVEQANALRMTLRTISEEAEDYLWPPSYEAGAVRIADTVCAQLTALINVTKAAFNETPIPQRGRRPALEGGLVRNLAAVLRENQLSADAKPNGLLCQLTAIVLKDTNKDVSDLADLVQRALRENSNNSD